MGLQDDVDAQRTILPLEQDGLATLQEGLDLVTQARDDAETAKGAAETEYETARDLAVAEFLTSYPDPADLVAGISTVEGSPIAIGTLNLEVGDTWAAADIETLQSEMDGFVSAYVPSGDTSTTVDDLELMLNDANNQLDSAGWRLLTRPRYVTTRRSRSRKPRTRSMTWSRHLQLHRLIYK